MNSQNSQGPDKPEFGMSDAQSAKTGLGLLLIICLTIGQSVQVFSRVPGTTGPVFVVAHLLCMVGQVWAYQAFVEELGRHDLIGIAIPILIQLVWFVRRIVGTIRLRQARIELEINDPGVGILYSKLSGYSAAVVNGASDMLIGGLLTIACFVLDSPILGNWYLIVTAALLFTHVWQDWHVRREDRRIDLARKRARAWSSRMNRSNRR